MVDVASECRQEDAYLLAFIFVVPINMSSEIRNVVYVAIF